MEFHNSSVHHSFSIPNHHDNSMAALSEAALVLACQRSEDSPRYMHAFIQSVSVAQVVEPRNLVVGSFESRPRQLQCFSVCFGRAALPHLFLPPLTSFSLPSPPHLFLPLPPLTSFSLPSPLSPSPHLPHSASCSAFISPPGTQSRTGLSLCPARNLSLLCR